MFYQHFKCIFKLKASKWILLLLRYSLDNRLLPVLELFLTIMSVAILLNSALRFHWKNVMRLWEVNHCFLDREKWYKTKHTSTYLTCWWSPFVAWSTKKCCRYVTKIYWSFFMLANVMVNFKLVEISKTDMCVVFEMRTNWVPHQLHVDDWMMTTVAGMIDSMKDMWKDWGILNNGILCENVTTAEYSRLWTLMVKCYCKNKSIFMSERNFSVLCFRNNCEIQEKLE